jgi:hypothetical protein
MDEIAELIERYQLQEETEYVIIPVTGRDGRRKRIFLLKRRYLRVVYPEGHHVDYPLAEIIEATVRWPDLPLSESLYLLHQERAAQQESQEDSDE